MTLANIVARMEPTGRRDAPPDDRLREIRLTRRRPRIALRSIRATTACARGVICPSGGLLTGLSSLISDFPKDISVAAHPKSSLEPFASHPTRGAFRERHGRGVECGGRGSVLRATGSQGGLAKGL